MARKMVLTITFDRTGKDGGIEHARLVIECDLPGDKVEKEGGKDDKKI